MIGLCLHWTVCTGAGYHPTAVVRAPSIETTEVDAKRLAACADYLRGLDSGASFLVQIEDLNASASEWVDTDREASATMTAASLPLRTFGDDARSLVDAALKRVHRNPRAASEQGNRHLQRIYAVSRTAGDVRYSHRPVDAGDHIPHLFHSPGLCMQYLPAVGQLLILPDEHGLFRLTMDVLLHPMPAGERGAVQLGELRWEELDSAFADQSGRTLHAYRASTESSTTVLALDEESRPAWIFQESEARTASTCVDYGDGSPFEIRQLILLPADRAIYRRFGCTDWKPLSPEGVKLSVGANTGLYRKDAALDYLGADPESWPPKVRNAVNVT